MNIFAPVQHPDGLINRMQTDLKNAINPLALLPLSAGRLTESLALTTSFQDISHKLGRAPLGWIIIAPDADARVWEDSVTNNPDVTKFLRLRASAAVNLKLWVF